MSSKFNMQQKLAQLDGAEWDSSSDDEPKMVTSKRKNKTKEFDSQSNIISLNSTDSNSNTSNNNAKTKGKRLQRKGNVMSSVVYLGHLPAGFEEEELGGFLSQFGDVIGLHVSRSKRTGNPKGYAFVKFRDAETAGIVSETMSGYFLMERRLISHVVAEKDVRPDMFSGKFRKVDWVGIHRDKVNRVRTAEEEEKREKKGRGKLAKKMDKLKAMGLVDYSVDELVGGGAAGKKKKEEKEVKKKAAAKKGKGKKRVSGEGAEAAGKRKKR
ncbi:hypothetical protein TrCOL_g3313 [Triparma columacea]|uniref:RRM domain-containing protein n=1 Tax=Triparma columacea TaxID=722753 RepID=A0A9W7GHK1_9STRA|nr:hypothetical protein TrCOL_g3313 [Triparma columacea]